MEDLTKYSRYLQPDVLLSFIFQHLQQVGSANEFKFMNDSPG